MAVAKPADGTPRLLNLPRPRGPVARMSAEPSAKADGADVMLCVLAEPSVIVGIVLHSSRPKGTLVVCRLVISALKRRRDVIAEWQQ